MSAYGEFETIMCEERLLVEGLTAMGYRAEVHADGAALVGYHGDARREKAHVIIRRAQLDSASNDIGFARGTDGRFRAILSEYDRGIGYNDQWLGKVHQHYKETDENEVTTIRERERFTQSLTVVYADGTTAILDERSKERHEECTSPHG